jgi:hypothetical protein
MPNDFIAFDYAVILISYYKIITLYILEKTSQFGIRKTLENFQKFLIYQLIFLLY